MLTSILARVPTRFNAGCPVRHACTPGPFPNALYLDCWGLSKCFTPDLLFNVIGISGWILIVVAAERVGRMLTSEAERAIRARTL